MLVANLGGPDAMLRVMTESEQPPPCGCPKNPPVFYKKVRFALYQFLVYRPIVQVATAVCIYAGKSQIGVLFAAISLVQFLYGFLSLLCFCKYSTLPMESSSYPSLFPCSLDKNLAEANVNVYGGTKFILLKVAVGLIIGQGVVQEVLFATHALEVKENDEYTADEREQRYLGSVSFFVIHKTPLIIYCLRYSYIQLS